MWFICCVMLVISTVLAGGFGIICTVQSVFGTVFFPSAVFGKKPRVFLSPDVFVSNLRVFGVIRCVLAGKIR